MLRLRSLSFFLNMLASPIQLKELQLKELLLDLLNCNEKENGILIKLYDVVKDKIVVTNINKDNQEYFLESNLYKEIFDILYDHKYKNSLSTAKDRSKKDLIIRYIKTKIIEPLRLLKELKEQRVVGDMKNSSSQDSIIPVEEIHHTSDINIPSDPESEDSAQDDDMRKDPDFECSISYSGMSGKRKYFISSFYFLYMY
jgi:hypothetical protein